MAEGYEPRPRGDTGWINISSYVNSSNMSVRSGYTPFIRVRDGILYLKGQVYISTKPTGTPNNVILFQNIPLNFLPTDQVSGGGLTYSEKRNYSLYTENGTIRGSCTSFEVQAQNAGFDISVLSGKAITSETDNIS